MRTPSLLVLCSTLLTLVLLGSCSSLDEQSSSTATIRIKNDFNNPAIERKPPWTICECSYQDVDFGDIAIGDSSQPRHVAPGLDYVLMVMAYNDTACSLHHCLPVASKNREECVDGQTRTIAINAPNHQGPCPPALSNIPPLPQEQYERIRAKWPQYGFKPYEQREQNPQCAP